MKVYIIYILNYDQSYIEAVYASQEEAEKHIRNNEYWGDPDIREEELRQEYEG